MLRKITLGLLGLLLSATLAMAANITVEKVITQGSVPVLSTCGTSPAVSAGSTDTNWRITVGTTASNACTLTFAAPVAGVTPFCVVQNQTTGAGANVYVVSATTIVWSSALADSTVLVGHCMWPAQ